ncbi:MAG: UDP-N-acetylmuramate dehydrogenase [Candidatus Sumerlaeota bacterium]|nr:UDP-N-acetylmuramate dehydrogenase [Candidatus Sumerlaeota bacterium]
MNTPFEFADSNHPLAPLTTYQVGGPARLVLKPRTLDEARDAYQWLCVQAGRKIILGCGSNVLFADEGFDGIILLTTELNRIEPQGDSCYQVESGTKLDDLVCNVMIAGNYEGVGCLTGIPGSVGGAIYMNAGAGDGSICQLIESVEVEGERGKRLAEISPDLYGYRHQTFCASGELILRARFRFKRAEKDQRAIYERYLQRRLDKHPQGACCGSVFRNPEGDHAGRLIEACGLKGLRRGGAVISPKHANFIMNEGGATCADILFLIALCKRAVKDRFGIELKEEVVIVSRV